MEIAQKEKAALLQRAVINSSVEELAKIYDELGYVEMSAPALGLACRFRGLEMVKCLVQKGATFDFPSTKKIEEQYNCYIGQHYGNYRTNYAMYLMKIFGENLSIFCLKGMTLVQSAEREQGEPLPFLSDEERVAVLRYLLENREQIAFHPEDLLFYAIYFKDTAIVKELREFGVKISEIRVKTITEGAPAMSGYWFEYVLLTGRLEDDDYLAVMQQIASDFDGKPFYFTENIYEITKKRFHDVHIFAFFLSNFKQDKMNKSEIMRGLIRENVLDAWPIVEREGWLNTQRRRDEMITYASEKENTEILAWLLDFKNRTADLAAEQEKAEKKMMRELNMSPDSVAALRKIWSYRKREDGTLMITNYKGTHVDVTVPEKIGRSIVTAIGDGAFQGKYDYNPSVTYEQMKQHNKIVKITLPKTLECIGKGTFYHMSALKELNLPAGMKEIGQNAFEGCSSLENIIIPEGIKEINEDTFKNCGALKNISIPKTVEKIGEYVFCGCTRLEEVHFCAGVKEIGKSAFRNCCALKNIAMPETVERIGKYAFYGCSRLKNAVIPKTVEKIEEKVFYDCGKLEEVHLCEGVKEIDNYAFNGCNALKDITIPQTVEKIGEFAFAVCKNLEKICLCAGVQKIDEYAFDGCISLKNITIPETVKEIGKHAFAGCSNLEEACLCAGVQKIGAYAFNKCGSLKNMIIPETVEKIGRCAFENCSKLEEVCIFAGVMEMGTLVFHDCSSLKKMIIHKFVPNRILGETFERCPQLMVYCQKGSKTEVYCKKKGIPFAYNEE